MKKKIGKFEIEIHANGKIDIIGDCSNFGRIYGHAIARFKCHPIGEESDWNRPQVIGMEWEYGLVPTVKKWIYGAILNGSFDHLIEE